MEQERRDQKTTEMTCDEVVARAIEFGQENGHPHDPRLNSICNALSQLSTDDLREVMDVCDGPEYGRSALLSDLVVINLADRGEEA